MLINLFLSVGLEVRSGCHNIFIFTSLFQIRDPPHSYYHDINEWWRGDGICDNSGWNKNTEGKLNKNTEGKLNTNTEGKLNKNTQGKLNFNNFTTQSSKRSLLMGA